jgi:serine/threonine protein kinase
MTDALRNNQLSENTDLNDESQNLQASKYSSNGEKDAASEEEIEIVTPQILNLDYRYVKLLGEGANGRTWLAKDRRNALNVAIKELKFVEDFKAFELFQRESEVLQSVSVKGVPVFYKNITQDLTSYIVQEYIPYPSLEKLLDEGKIFDEDEVFEIIEKVSEILLALETQYVPAIVHRDIKPGNILYCPRDHQHDETRVWLIDFGSVDNAHKQSSGSTIAGTFGYMAPEQLQGEVSVRSDFYGLGATALHLLTGVFPYEIPVELFQMKFHPVIEEKAPNTTKPMVDLLDKMLASNPEHRHEDIKALCKAIYEARELSKKYRTIQFGNSVVDYPARTRLGRWFRRTKVGSRMHNTNLAFKQWRLDKRRDFRIKMLEWEERREQKRRAAEEKKLAALRAESGIVCECTVKRVSVVTYGMTAAAGTESMNVLGMTDALDKSLLEGIFCYEGDWHPAYIVANARLNSDFDIKCTTQAPPDTKISENTFKVNFLPDKCDITVIKNQTIWLTPVFYTKFTGKVAPKARK